jgi:hypothetical protein
MPAPVGAFITLAPNFRRQCTHRKLLNKTLCARTNRLISNRQPARQEKFSEISAAIVHISGEIPHIFGPISAFGVKTSLLAARAGARGLQESCLCSFGRCFHRRCSHQYWVGSSRTNCSIALVYSAVTQRSGSSLSAHSWGKIMRVTPTSK